MSTRSFASPHAWKPSYEDLERRVMKLEHTLRDSELVLAALVRAMGGSVLIGPEHLVNVERGSLRRTDQVDGAMLFEVADV